MADITAAVVTVSDRSFRGEREDLSGPLLKKLAAARGYAIDNGYGKIKNLTFRIAHMADFTMSDMTELFAVLDELLPAARKQG